MPLEGGPPTVLAEGQLGVQNIGVDAVSVYPAGLGHIVCDNLSDHDTDDVLDWFEEHPRWTRHFTPKHASWLNQIECAFSMLGRQILARGSFDSLEQLRDAIDRYLLWFNAQEKPPFRWSYRPKSWHLAMPN